MFIVRAMVAASAELIPELRLLQQLLEREGLELDVRWSPSAENRYADRLSRSWDPTAPQCTRAVIALLTASLSTVLGKGTVFRYRLSGGKHPVAQRKQAEAALNEWWGDGRARFFNPPPELLGLTMSKIVRERALGIVVVPLWLKSPSVARLRRIAEAVRVLMPEKGRPLVAGARARTEKCPLLLAEVGIASGKRGDPPGAAESAARAWEKHLSGRRA